LGSTNDVVNENKKIDKIITILYKFNNSLFKYYMILLSKTMVDFLKGAAKHTYPNEFIGLLREKNGVISEILIIPNSQVGKGFAFLRDIMIPIVSDSIGSVHSHPSRNNKPSKQDLIFFQRKGKIHIIICTPYEDRDIAVYDKNGTQLDFKIM
jgi:proteasome lid subunit RPN8/RPN11